MKRGGGVIREGGLNRGFTVVQVFLVLFRRATSIHTVCPQV